MPGQTRFFELVDHVGVDADGHHEPLAEIGLALPLPTMRDGEVVEVAVPTTIEPAPSIGHRPARIVPDTRIVEVADLVVVGQLLGSGKYIEIAPPTSAQIKKAHEKTQAHRQARASDPSPEPAKAESSTEEA